MNLEKAIQIAVDAHAGQTDKAGAPYILHPIRVMLGLRRQKEQIVAVLHDVVEDSRWTLSDLLAEGFNDDVVSAIDALTKRGGEAYNDYLGRVAKNDLAVRVKLEDLRDNSNLHRLVEPTQRDYDRLRRYRDAWQKLTGVSFPSR